MRNFGVWGREEWKLTRSTAGRVLRHRHNDGKIFHTSVPSRRRPVICPTRALAVLRSGVEVPPSGPSAIKTESQTRRLPQVADGHKPLWLLGIRLRRCRWHQEAFWVPCQVRVSVKGESSDYGCLRSRIGCGLIWRFRTLFLQILGTTA